MNGAVSGTLNVALSSSNSNISPVVNVATAKGTFITNSINNQPLDDLTSTNTSGSVVSPLTITSAGSGYVTAPTVKIYGTGTGATATCTISNGSVNSITLTNAGSGYYTTPTIKFIGGGTGGVTPGSADGVNGTPATAIATITSFNTELDPKAGLAQSRYITKKQTVATVSSGIRLYATAYSNLNSSFDVYIKTSLTSSGDNHDNQPWTMLECDIDRNASVKTGQFLEYTLYKDGLSSFDTFSIKFVLRTQTPWDPPVINEYRTIILAA